MCLAPASVVHFITGLRKNYFVRLDWQEPWFLDSFFFFFFPSGFLSTVIAFGKNCFLPVALCSCNSVYDYKNPSCYEVLGNDVQTAMWKCTLHRHSVDASGGKYLLITCDYGLWVMGILDMPHTVSSGQRLEKLDIWLW